MKKSINYLFIFGFLFFVFSFSVNALEASMSVKCNTLKLNGSSTCKVYANISGGGLEGVSVSSLEIVSGDDVIAIAETFKANDNRFSARKNVYLGTFKIKVTSEKGSSRTYKIIVNRADDRSNNALLSTLTLDSGKLNFDKNVFNYEVKVLNAVEKINVVANAEDAKAKVDVTNPDTLKEGENNIVIKVTAENGSTQEYTIKVNRLKAGEVMGDNPNIKLLTITGYTINFNPLTTSYNLKIDNKADSLGINVIMEEDGATYLISGNENLKDGSVIVIDTTSLDGTKNTYKIIIEKSNTDFYILIGAGVLLVGSLSAIIAIMVKKRKGKNNGIMDSIGSSAGSVDVSKSDAVEDVNPIQEESVEGGDFGKSKSWFRKHKSIPKNEVMSFEELKKYDPTNKENGIVGRSAPSEEYERVEITEDQTKQCPKCGHRINFSAKVCPYCDKEF